MTPKKKIETLMEEFISLGAVLPGGISRVFNVCGKATCRCKDKDDPQRHGPYNLLSYTIAGKSSSKFIKEHDLKQTEVMLARHQRLKEICQELPVAYMDLFKEQGLEEAIDFSRSMILKFETANFGDKRLLHHINELKKRLERWSSKATERAGIINTQKARITQLEKSRDYWKQRAMSQKDGQSESKQKKNG